MALHPIKIQTFFNGFLHYSTYIDYFSINCVPKLAKKGVVVSDSPVPVAKIDTACKSNISIFKKKDHENVGTLDLRILITHLVSFGHCVFCSS